MREVYKNLWVGDENDVARAREKGYAIVSACKDGISSHRQLLGYTSMGAPKGPEYLVARRKDHLFLNLIDGDRADYVPDKVIDEALSFISEHLDKGKSVLVHCCRRNQPRPVNRSAVARQERKVARRWRGTKVQAVISGLRSIARNQNLYEAKNCFSKVTNGKSITEVDPERYRDGQRSQWDARAN